MPSWSSRGGRTRRTPRGTTIGTTRFTSGGSRSRARLPRSRAISIATSTASPTGPATWPSSRVSSSGSRPASAGRRASTMDTKYTPREMMAVVAARELRDGEVVFVGIGLPNLACNLARATHAPNLVLIYESGAVGAVPERLPVSIGDPALVTNCLSVVSQADIFQSYLQRGLIEVGFLGGAQIDKYGNLNTTVIGDYANPKVRLPGSGGACEIAAHS